MLNLRSVAFAALLAITWLGIFTLLPIPSAKAETNAAPSPPALATDMRLSATAPKTRPPAGGVTSGGMTARNTVKRGVYVVRTVWKGGPLPGVRVEWRRKPDDAVPALVGTTIRFGTAKFNPEAGAYYLTADWRQDGDFVRPRKSGDRFAWLGANPLLVSSEIGGEITLLLNEVPPLSLPPPTGTGVFGRVTLDNLPLADVGVFAYAKTGSGFNGDDYQAIIRTNEKGEFALKLPPGRYYLLARLRIADNSVALGPLHKEDLLGYDPRNPVVVGEGRYAVSSIPVFHLKMVKTRAESSGFSPETIEGRIVDRNGHPVSGVYAALYEKPQMHGRSVFRSEPTGSDGRFKLSVPIPGSYFLGARSGYGSPESDDWTGKWDGSSDHSIPIKTGEARTGIEIVVDRPLQEVKPSGNP